MATVAVDFIHLDLECKAGDVLPDDHELVALAPHLFVQPDDDPTASADTTPTPAVKAKRTKES